MACEDYIVICSNNLVVVLLLATLNLMFIVYVFTYVIDVDYQT